MKRPKLKKAGLANWILGIDKYADHIEHQNAELLEAMLRIAESHEDWTQEEMQLFAAEAIKKAEA